MPVSSRHVALLRGINVGRAKRIAMADLRALIESLGATEVRTLLNSGNVVFAQSGTPKPDFAARIEAAMTKRLGFSARVTVLTAREFAGAVRDNPLLGIAKDPARLLVAVMSRPADRSRLAPLTRQDWAPESLAVGKRVAYLWCAGGILKSNLLTAVSRTLGDGVTSRNWATMLKIQALIEE